MADPRLVAVAAYVLAAVAIVGLVALRTSSDRRVRFHAAQSVLLGVVLAGVFVAGSLLAAIPGGGFLGEVLGLAWGAVWLRAMLAGWRLEDLLLPAIGPVAWRWADRYGPGEDAVADATGPAAPGAGAPRPDGGGPPGAVPPAVAGAPALACEAVGVELPDGTTLLDGLSFAVEQGELVAVVGPTGCGKSTLLKVLTGYLAPTRGSVRYGGEDFFRHFDALRSQVGYVPQDDILHIQLRLRRALEFGAELRFAETSTGTERSERIDEVVVELGLDERQQVRIENLSGGQRKRTSVALELLTKPPFLFLDEPTSGLDPGFERSVMRLLRDLADGGRAVTVVTHSVQSLHLCDRVLILAPGGVVAYFGPPSGVLAHFRRGTYAEVFDDLNSGRWSPRTRSSQAAPTAPPTLPATGGRDRWRIRRPAFLTLARRQLAVLAADRRQLGYLLAEVLIPTALISLLTDPGVLSTGNGPQAGARTLVAALVVSSAAIGAANTLREIVKEYPIHLRERAAGVRTSEFLASKALVFGGVTAAQTSLLGLVAVARAGGVPSSAFLPWPLLELLIGLGLTGFGTVCLGLLLSALVDTSEKAMALIPVVFIVQWLFSGVALDLQDKPLLKPVAYATTANWGVAAVAATTHLTELDGCAGSTTATPEAAGAPTPAPSCPFRWRPNPLLWLSSIMFLIASAAGMLWLAAGVLDRRTSLLKQPLAATLRRHGGAWLRPQRP